MQKKEALAIKMLAAEDLERFQSVKTSLVEIAILTFNLNLDQVKSQFEHLLVTCVLIQTKDRAAQDAIEKFERLVFLPETSFPAKVCFDNYYN